MRKVTLRVLVAFCGLFPMVAACQGKATHAKPDAPTTNAPVVHNFGERTTLIEHGDTLTWIRGNKLSDGRTVTDTSVYVLGKTPLRISPGKPRPIPPYLADKFRQLRQFARDQDELERKLGVPLR